MAEDDAFAAIAAQAKETHKLSRKDRKAAKAEEDVLADGQKAVQKEIHTIAVWVLRVGALLIGAIVVVRLWHLVGPEACRWLTVEDIQGIDKMLFSSAFGGLVLGYLKDIMKPLNSSDSP